MVSCWEINKIVPVGLSCPILSGRLAPYSVDHDFARLRSRMSLCMCDGRYSPGLLYEACRYKLHQWKPWKSVCSYVVLGHVCCYGYYASQERINVCTVPMVPWLCCHPLLGPINSAHSETTGVMNRINKMLTMHFLLHFTVRSLGTA